MDAAEEVLPGIKDDLLGGKIKPKESEVAAIARASPIDRREMAEQLRVPREDKTMTRQTTDKYRRKDYREIEADYAELRNQDKKVTENDALDSIKASVKSMLRVCDNFIEYFPRLISDDGYKDKLVEIMQKPKSYIQKLEGESK